MPDARLMAGPIALAAAIVPAVSAARAAEPAKSEGEAPTAEPPILANWYNQYCEDWKSDPTGVKAIEKTYGKPLAEFQADWLKFVDGLDFKMPRPPAPPKAEPKAEP